LEKQPKGRVQTSGLLGRHDELLPLPVDETPTAMELLDSVGCAAVLLDERAECIAYNARANLLFGIDLKLSGRRITAAHKASNDLLKELIHTSLAGIGFSPKLLLPPVAVQRKEGRPIVAQILHASGATGPNGEPAKAILLLTSLDAPPEIPETRLMLLFALTPAEARLATRLSAGDALEEIARALNISLGTARNQLKSVFSKTATKRQSELVALLWRVSDLAISTSFVPGRAPRSRLAQ
jgi:DNA-binding CsgD family transcriptional regulator